MKRKSITLAVTAFSALAAVTQSSSAAVLAGWDFDPLAGGLNNFGASPLSATTAAANLTVGGLTRGSGVGTTGTGAANAWGGNDFIIATPTEAAAITANEFATVGITASTGFTVSYDNIAAYNIRRSATGPSTGQWQYQLGSGSFVDIGTDITWGGTTTAVGNTQPLINLTGISALQNVAAGTAVTFRAVTWGATSTGGTWYLNDPVGAAGNDFVINGTVTAVPEPSSALLGGLGLLALLRRRR